MNVQSLASKGHEYLHRNIRFRCTELSTGRFKDSGAPDMSKPAATVPSLCGTFRKQAGTVLNQMLTASQLGLALSEETITGTVLYNIAAVHQYGNIVIYPAHKAAEAKHGADWEWWLVHGTKFLGFRIQAKRLPNGRYEGLAKDNYTQLNKLVSAASYGK
jgi:hypothetical protein